MINVPARVRAYVWDVGAMDVAGLESLARQARISADHPTQHLWHQGKPLGRADCLRIAEIAEAERARRE